MARFLECCCTSLQDAIEAQAGGAQRVELCTDLSCGGVTPSTQMISEVMENLSIKVNVLVRARGGDFVFNEDEIQQMLQSIDKCKEIGVNGVVIGALDKEGNVDMPTMERLISRARPLSVTFHRAFDECADPMTAFEQIIALGCDRLLTSGHESDAFKGRFLIADLVKKAKETNSHIAVMAGCGVRPNNIAQIEKDSGAPEYHSTSHGPSGNTEREIVLQLVNNVS